MRSQRLTSGRPRKWHRYRAQDAFSLIELMVAVTILSLLFLLAVPTYQKLQRKAKTAAIVNDFRTFAATFQAHAHELGSWPSEASEGIVPDGMTPQELKFDDWTRTTPIGGKFDWERDQVHPGATRADGKVTAAIRIAQTSDAPLVRDDALYLEIDQIIDDGVLETGYFRLGYGETPLFVIEN